MVDTKLFFCIVEEQQGELNNWKAFEFSNERKGLSVFKTQKKHPDFSECFFNFRTQLFIQLSRNFSSEIFFFFLKTFT